MDYIFVTSIHHNPPDISAIEETTRENAKRLSQHSKLRNIKTSNFLFEFGDLEI